MIGISALLAGAGGWEPLNSPPSGWTWVALPGEHSTRGVYHDSVSGAYVCIDIGPRSIVGSWLSTTRHDKSVTWSRGTTANGRPYDLATAKDANAVVARTEPRTTENAKERSDDPNFPRRCSLLAVIFATESGNSDDPEVATFYSATCSTLQRQRVRSLLLERPSVNTAAEWTPPAGDPPTRLRTGTTLRQLLAANGQPYDCRRSGSEGLVLSFGSGKPTGLVEFTFDRDQKLTSVTDLAPSDVSEACEPRLVQRLSRVIGSTRSRT
jgi:hypothetical protein